MVLNYILVGCPCFQLNFPHWVKVILFEWDWTSKQWPVTKSIDGYFHLLVACSQSSFTSVWTRLATPELQISFRCWWTQFGNCIDIWWDVRGIHIQLKPLKLNSGSRKRDIRLSSKKDLCIRIAVKWNNRIKYNAFVRHHGAERDFRTRSKKKKDHVFCYFRGRLRPRNDPQLVDPKMIPTPKWSPVNFRNGMMSWNYGSSKMYNHD